MFGQNFHQKNSFFGEMPIFSCHKVITLTRFRWMGVKWAHC